MVEYNIEVQTGGIQIQYRSSQFNISWFQSRFQSYQFFYIDKLFRRKKFFFYCQIMVLNFTRNANSLILMSHYIAEEQDLPAYLQ